MKFVVGKDGKISGMQVASKNIDPLLRDAAIKAVAQLPDWIPGEDEQGNKVAVYFTLPINFKLDEKDKKTTHTKLNAREVEVGKRQLQREASALTGSDKPVKLDISDPTHREILAQVHSLLSEVTNGPIFVNPEEKAAVNTGDRKFVMQNGGMSVDKVLAKLQGDGLEVREVSPGTAENDGQSQGTRKIKLRLGSHNGVKIQNE